MRTDIPQGLRVTYLISFVLSLVFGLAGTLAARAVGDLAGHPVRDVDVNALLGVAALAIGLGHWFGYRAARWEQISVFTAMMIFFYLVGGIGGLVAYFVPSLFGVDKLPLVQLLVVILMLLQGAACAYFYSTIQGWRSPLLPKK